MGLLDSLFDQSNYDGQNGGLLDLLKNYQQMAQQPSPAAPPNWPGATPQSRIDGAFAQMQPPQQPPMNLTPDRMVGIGSGAGSYQMPQFGNAPAAQDQAQLPPNATPTQGTMPQGQPAQGQAAPQQAQQQLPPAFGQSTGNPIGDRLMAGFQGLSNSKGLLPALTNAVAGFATGQRNDPAGLQQQNLKAQYESLVPILGPSKAMLAVMNPEAGKTLISEAMTNKEKWGEIGSDSFGNKTMGWINERDQTINGKGVGEGAAEGQSGSGFMAPGVKQVDSSLTGRDYLKQFSPEVQAAVQNYVDGKSTPTGNPRKGFTQAVKMIAQKYGDDTGQSVDDTTYAARRTMRNQLSSSAPASLGGQINIGNTAAGHLADLSQKAVELGNYDTGIAPLSAAVNGIRGLGTEQAAKMEALKGAAQHYGQEITKFYAGSPGGTAERDRFIESVNGARSPKELAAILATEGELMRSRLDALGGQITGVLGEEGAKQYPVLRADGQAALTKVQENVAKLKGGAPASTAGGPDRSAVEAEMRRRGLMK